MALEAIPCRYDKSAANEFEKEVNEITAARISRCKWPLAFNFMIL